MGKYIILIVNMVIALLIAAIGGLIGLFWGITWGHYFGIFFGLIALQFGIGWMWTYYVDAHMNAILEEAKSRKALADSIQYVEIACAYCSTKNQVELLHNKENYFSCMACKQNNHVSIAMATERTTKPLEKEAITEIFRKLDNK